MRLHVLDGLYIDIILGTDFLEQHESVTIVYGGSKPLISFAALTTMNTDPPPLFVNLTADCKAITTKSRKNSKADQDFIRSEVKLLTEAGIIEPSNSPWRAQVLVVNEKFKHRMFVDYSETINKYTQLDAYPLPKRNEMVNSIVKYKVFSTTDLRSAYYQVPLAQEDTPFATLETDGKLWQYTRVPFGPTNGVSCFQRKMDNFVAKYELNNIFPYTDNVTICGDNQEEHHIDLKAFREAEKNCWHVFVLCQMDQSVL